MVRARLRQNGEVIQEVRLRYAGVESTYSGQLRMPFSGSYTLEVLALEPTHANFGRVEQALTVLR